MARPPPELLPVVGGDRVAGAAVRRDPGVRPRRGPAATLRPQPHALRVQPILQVSCH